MSIMLLRVILCATWVTVSNCLGYPPPYIPYGPAYPPHVYPQGSGYSAFGFHPYGPGYNPNFHPHRPDYPPRYPNYPNYPHYPSHPPDIRPPRPPNNFPHGPGFSPNHIQPQPTKLCQRSLDNKQMTCPSSFLARNDLNNPDLETLEVIFDTSDTLPTNVLRNVRNLKNLIVSADRTLPNTLNPCSLDDEMDKLFTHTVPGLESITVRDTNDLICTIPNVVNYGSSVKRIHFDNSNVKSIPELHLRNLETVSMHNHKMHDVPWNSFKNQPNLKMDVKYCKSKPDFYQMSTLDGKITELNVNNCDLNDNDFISIMKNLNQIHKLDLSNNFIGGSTKWCDSSSMFFVDLPRLTSLKLDNNRELKRMCEYLFDKASNLNFLGISNIGLRSFDFNVLTNANNLRHINAKGNHFINSLNLQHSSLPQSLTVDFSNSTLSSIYNLSSGSDWLANKSGTLNLKGNQHLMCNVTGEPHMYHWIQAMNRDRLKVITDDGTQCVWTNGTVVTWPPASAVIGTAPIDAGSSITIMTTHFVSPATPSSNTETTTKDYDDGYSYFDDDNF